MLVIDSSGKSTVVFTSMQASLIANPSNIHRLATAGTERQTRDREGGGDKTENPCPSCGKVHKGVSSRDCNAHLKTK